VALRGVEGWKGNKEVYRGQQSTALQRGGGVYLRPRGLRGPQVRSAGGTTVPAARANRRGEREAEPERDSLKQLWREHGS